MISVVTNKILKPNDRKFLSTFISEQTYLNVPNKTEFHESLFSDIVCEGYLIQTELDGKPVTYIADFEQGADELTELIGADGLNPDELRDALQKQLIHEAKVFAKGIEQGRALQQKQMRAVLGV